MITEDDPKGSTWVPLSGSETGHPSATLENQGSWGLLPRCWMGTVMLPPPGGTTRSTPVRFTAQPDARATTMLWDRFARVWSFHIASR